MRERVSVTLNDVSAIVPGYAFKGRHFGPHGHPVIKIKDINPPAINLSDTVSVDLSHYDKTKLSKYLISKGDFVVAMTGATIGKIGKLTVDEHVYVNQRVAIVRPYDTVSKEFIYYCIQGSDFQVFVQNNIDSHSAQENISGTSLGRYDFHLPPLPEQKAIASVLSSLDDKIDLLHRQNKTLEAMAETLFRQWFVEEADESWEEVKLGDLVETNQSVLRKTTPLTQIQYLDTGSITEGKVSELQVMPLSEAPSRARRIVQHNDILVSTVRPNQKHYGMMRNPAQDLIVSTGFTVVSCREICPFFVYIFLTTDEMTEYLHSIAEGSTSTYPSLKPSDIENLEFALPPKELLEKFTEFCTSIWDRIEYNSSQASHLEKLRDVLLPKLMSGEVRVQL